MTNPKTEKLNADIVRAKEKIAALTAKLRKYEQRKAALEKEEVNALFEREKLNEDGLAALLRSQRDDEMGETSGIPAKSENNEGGKHKQ